MHSIIFVFLGALLATVLHTFPDAIPPGPVETSIVLCFAGAVAFGFLEYRETSHRLDELDDAMAQLPTLQHHRHHTETATLAWTPKSRIGRICSAVWAWL
jgi:hypothetical protein